MKNVFFILVLLVVFTSCKSTKHTKIVTTKDNNTSQTYTKNTSTKAKLKSNNAIVRSVIDHAIKFEGVRYKYGGTTSRGMDCSGLIYVSFHKENVSLPRISRDMAKRGKRIKLNDVMEGDLLFFKTNKSRNVINHVGLVTKTSNGNILFIHATSSKGVITSSLSESYWNNAFVESRRVL